MFFMHKSTVKIDSASQVTVVVDRASREQLLVCNPCLKGSRRLVVTYLLLYLLVSEIPLGIVGREIVFGKGRCAVCH